ncbi:phosphate propanoyltransferase [Paenibacillus spongiae]|uniref:Phosphate propanoyltransferase n=1 Tax=Paenibacillus spongiae TaxID=2909671 RepID=A0ABY5S9B4_9BACL|nr:phosphate propanoyltransferase [Paenibacillus spongiae]UVI30512.1 phosphate propanoyltransferase [Paenibacillus spongiae]
MAFITESQLRALLPQGLPNPFRLSGGDRLTPAARDFLRDRGIPVTEAPVVSSSGEARRHKPEADIPVGVSNRHIHLSEEHVRLLFGQGHTLMPMKALSQRGQFAAHETVSLAGPKGMIKNVRVLGPSRGETQVEITRTDGFLLGIQPPLRLSGDHADTPGIALYGPKGLVVIESGVIVAKAHIHMSPADAARYGVTHGDRVSVQTHGQRPLTFGEVAIRVHADFSLDFHIDTDEANAAFLQQGDYVSISAGGSDAAWAKG